MGEFVGASFYDIRLQFPDSRGRYPEHWLGVHLMVVRRGSGSAGDAPSQDAVASLLVVAAALLSSVVSLLVLGSLLVLAEVPVPIRKAVLLISILLLALGQPHFVSEFARRFRMANDGSRFVSLGTITSSLALLALGVLVSWTL